MAGGGVTLPPPARNSPLTPLLVQQSVDQATGVDLQRLRDFEKLNDVEASFATLVFGHEGLGSAQFHRHLVLSEIDCLAGFNQETAQPLVLFGEDRPTQATSR